MSLFFIRVKTCTDQNRFLQKKIDSLEEQNKSLLEQLKSLQELVSSSNQSKKQTSTCILVLFLAFALVAFPFQNLTSSPAKTNKVADTYATMSGKLIERLVILFSYGLLCPSRKWDDKNGRDCRKPIQTILFLDIQ